MEIKNKKEQGIITLILLIIVALIVLEVVFKFNVLDWIKQSVDFVKSFFK